MIFGKKKVKIAMLVPGAGGGVQVLYTQGKFVRLAGSLSLQLKSGIIIPFYNESLIGDIYYTYTPDSKVFFPVKLRLLPENITQKILSYKNAHIEEIKAIEDRQDLSEEEKNKKKQELLLQALSPEERAMVKEYNIFLDALPDRQSFEVLKYQLVESARAMANRGLNKIEKWMPLITIIGIAVAFAIIITATTQYMNTITKIAGQIANTLGPVAQALKQAVLASGIHSNATTTAVATVPPP